MNMKNILLLVILLATSNILFAQKPKKTEKAVIKTHIYCSHCKVCETCGQLFQVHLPEIKGVKSYELDDKTMTITVYYNPEKINLDEIRAAISNLGYDADDVKANPAAYAKLDGCCKKK